MSSRSTRGRTQPKGLSPRTLILWGTGIVVAAGIVIAIGLANRSVLPQASEVFGSTIAVGDKAPDFSVATSTGTFSLADAKRPVLLEVFATWCPHCQKETATLNAIYDKYKDRIDVVAVSGSPLAVDHNTAASLDDVLGFAQHFGVRYPIAYDQSLGVAKSYLGNGFPTIAIIGTDKRVQYLDSGEVAQPKLEAAISKVLSKG